MDGCDYCIMYIMQCVCFFFGFIILFALGLGSDSVNVFLDFLLAQTKKVGKKGGHGERGGVVLMSL